MIIRLTAILLMAALVMPAGEPPMTKASKTSSGSVVILKLNSGEEVRGRLIAVETDSVTVMTATEASIGERIVPAGEIKAFRVPTDRTRTILAGLGGAYLILYAIMVPVALLAGV